MKGEAVVMVRYLAESNCSTRFCRPLPNRSAKVPLFQSECKGSVLFLFLQIFVAISFLAWAFSLTGCHLTFVCRAASAIGTGVAGIADGTPDPDNHIRYSA